MSMGIRANNVLAFECDEPLYHTKEFNRVSYLNALILPWSALRSSAGMGFGLLDKNSLLGNGCIEKSMITILTMANRKYGSLSVTATIIIQLSPAKSIVNR